MFYVVINEQYHVLETREQILAAEALMTELGVRELPVWYTKASLDEIEAQDDPNVYDTRFQLFAAGCDPALNEP